MSETNEAGWFEANRVMWDERVGIHAASEFYDVPGFRAGRNTLQSFEIAEVGDVTGLHLLHLQCHFGMDTLSWARLGARVSGLDFSPEAVATATKLATELGLDATFVCANVYDAVAAFEGERFDIVYTGFGAIIWLPDIERWARTVAALVRPGGLFYVAEGHPAASVFSDTSLTAEYDYFRDPANPYAWNDAGSYADASASTVHNLSYEWPHPLGSVVTALIAAGLRIEFLHEFDYTLWARWPFLEKNAAGEYHLPAGMPRLPLMYSIRASKPA